MANPSTPPYLASILGYGDCLITLSLLERAGGAHGQVRLVGTGVTAAVSELLRTPRCVDERILDGVAAFFTVRENKLSAVLRDAWRFRRWADRSDHNGGTLILENQDWRTRLLVPGRRWRRIDIPRTTTAYEDRERLLRPWLGPQPWPSVAHPQGTARHLVINPSARARDRVLPLTVVQRAAEQARAASAEVSLIDVDGSFDGLRKQVNRYLAAPSLKDAAALLAQSDRYLGPDSFFMHLAYYLGIPQLAFFHQQNLYFTPPGLQQAGGMLFYSQASDLNLLDPALNGLIHGPT